MTVDNFLAESCVLNAEPVIRFYTWQPFCVSLGFHQDKNVLDYDALYRFGVDVVRRPTGGRAIYHADELTYSAVFARNLIHHKKLYGFLHEIIAQSFSVLGYNVVLSENKSVMPAIKQTANDFPCFTKSANTEIQHKNRKLVGSAQKILKNGILQHGSIMLKQTHTQLGNFLAGNSQQKRAITEELQNKTVSLHEIMKIDINPEKIIRTVTRQLESITNISVYFQELSHSEIEESGKYEIPI